MSSLDIEKSTIDLRQLNAELSAGTSIPIGSNACYRNNYTTEYNFSVTNWNTLEGSAEKKPMHSGYLLLDRIFIFSYLVIAACSIIPLVLIAQYSNGSKIV
ncbi:unnamed protein product [Rotaria socialis]|uniref:Uncharacterized protein n=1 Tax=Rotaria socialis TaxID=392032 RepID=A0A818KF93_9BILA|nr:unnamed protein product [Rotaria socialis]CAF4847650.1 unnamed protein product [Rotaria socialis]